MQSTEQPLQQLSETIAKSLQSGSKLKLSRTGQLKAPKATILLYAPPRWGKTHVLRTLPHPLLLATELGVTKGLVTLQDVNMPYIPIETSDQMILVCKDLITNKCVIEGEQFEAIAIDSVSNLGYEWLEDAKKANNWGDLFMTKGKGKDPRNAYSYIAEKGRQTVTLALDIPAHLVLVCRQTVVDEGEGDDRISYVAPELPGQKLPREIPGWPDAVLRGDWLNGRRVLRTKTSNRAIAGIRVPGDITVPEFIKPDLGAVIRLMLGDKTALEALKLEEARPNATPPNVRK